MKQDETIRKAYAAGYRVTPEGEALRPDGRGWRVCPRGKVSLGRPGMNAIRFAAYCRDGESALAFHVRAKAGRQGRLCRTWPKSSE